MIFPRNGPAPTGSPAPPAANGPGRTLTLIEVVEHGWIGADFRPLDHSDLQGALAGRVFRIGVLVRLVAMASLTVRGVEILASRDLGLIEVAEQRLVPFGRLESGHPLLHLEQTVGQHRRAKPVLADGAKIHLAEDAEHLPDVAADRIAGDAVPLHVALLRRGPEERVAHWRIRGAIVLRFMQRPGCDRVQDVTERIQATEAVRFDGPAGGHQLA